MQAYETIRGTAAASLTEKKSEFLAAAAHVETERQALAFLEEVRAQNRTARHNVYAYCLREENRARYSDDGEPAKTAGLPVLEAIQHAGLVDVIVVVTRYFGGILLGTGGLVRAYTGAAQAALQAAGRVCVRPCVRVQAELEYTLYDRALPLIREAGAQVEDTAYGTRVALRLLLPAGGETALVQKLTELSRGQAVLQVSDPFYAAL